MTLAAFLKDIHESKDSDGFLLSETNQEYLDDIYSQIFVLLDERLGGDKAAQIAGMAQSLAMLELLQLSEQP